ncbi:MAG: fructosamine kinase family protein [Myxococcota bacterium]
MDALTRARTLAGVDATPRPLSGGDISRVFQVGDRVVKLLDQPPAGFFEAEARGLLRLRMAGAPVPEVLDVFEDALVLSYHAPGEPDWRWFGQTMAALHRTQASAYGSETALFLGRFGLPAGTRHDATKALVDLRLRPLLDATRAQLGPRRSERVERFLDGLDLPNEGPSEVHGDLWSGNVLHTTKGPMLIDPSAQGAERAYDLAMMRWLGGFPSSFWEAYDAHYPRPPAVHASLPAYTLVFVLVHVAMFGGYLDAVDQIV